VKAILQIASRIRSWLAHLWSRLEHRAPILRTRWRWVALAIVVAGAGLAWASLSLFVRHDATLEQVQSSRVWLVALDPSFPPFESLDESTGKPVGFDVDLAEAIAARWGVRAQIVPAGFDELVDAVSAHRVQSAISALPVFPWRVKEVSFSSPYVEAGLLLAAPAGSPITSTASLAGRRVAVEWGSEGDAQARALQSELKPAARLLPLESPEAALSAVAGGQADATIIDAISLALFNRTASTRLKAIGAPLRSDPYVVIVPRDAGGLLQAVDDALAALEADGTLSRLRAKWLAEY
jgi:ABC-type amino acid transport substrate-binding protein